MEISAFVLDVCLHGTWVSERRVDPLLSCRADRRN